MKFSKKLKNSNLLYARAPIIYRDDWFDDYQPNKFFYIPLEFRLRLYKKGKRFTASNGTEAYPFSNRLLIDLTYNSSRLEGAYIQYNNYAF